MEASNSIHSKVETWGNLVVISHSIFALPFALLMIGIVSKYQTVSRKEILLLVLCVISARTAAMAFNRVIDADLDALNPRTIDREIPAGRVSKLEGALLTIVASVLFLVASAMLGTHCLLCAPLVLLLLFGYSAFKRFSALCHFVLGAALACAPGGVWYALTGEFSLQPVPLMVAVLVWVAGFDVIYSLQDEQFDRQLSLHSCAVLLGTRGALVLAAVLHALSVSLLGLTGWIFQMGPGFWCGLTVFAVSVAAQHFDVRRCGVSAIDRAFFIRNGVASAALCTLALLDLILK